MAAVRATASSTISGAYIEQAAPTLTLRQKVCAAHVQGLVSYDAEMRMAVMSSWMKDNSRAAQREQAGSRAVSN